MLLLFFHLQTHTKIGYNKDRKESRRTGTMGDIRPPAPSGAAGDCNRVHAMHFLGGLRFRGPVPLNAQPAI